MDPSMVVNYSIQHVGAKLINPLYNHFVNRDELCRGGDLLHSPALGYTLVHLASAVEATRQQKLLQEQPEEEGETRSSEESMRVKGTNTKTVCALQLGTLLVDGQLLPSSASLSLTRKEWWNKIVKLYLEFYYSALELGYFSFSATYICTKLNVHTCKNRKYIYGIMHLFLLSCFSCVYLISISHIRKLGL